MPWPLFELGWLGYGAEPRKPFSACRRLQSEQLPASPPKLDSSKPTCFDALKLHHRPASPTLEPNLERLTFSRLEASERSILRPTVGPGHASLIFPPLVPNLSCIRI